MPVMHDSSAWVRQDAGMRVLVVIFGGLDHEFLSRWDCKSLRQAEWGKVTVDELWNQRESPPRSLRS